VGRLTVGICGLGPELRDGIDQQSEDDGQDDPRDGQDKKGQIEDGLGRRGLGREDFRDATCGGLGGAVEMNIGQASGPEVLTARWSVLCFSCA
jgi:hypothetical protein